MVKGGLCDIGGGGLGLCSHGMGAGRLRRLKSSAERRRRLQTSSGTASGDTQSSGDGSQSSGTQSDGSQSDADDDGQKLSEAQCEVKMKEIFDLKTKKGDSGEISERRIQVGPYDVDLFTSQLFKSRTNCFSSSVKRRKL